MTQLVFCSLYSTRVLLLTEQKKHHTQWEKHRTQRTRLFMFYFLVCAHSADTLSLAR